MTVPRIGILRWKKEPVDEDALARVNDAQRRDRVLGEFNASTLDSVGPLGGDQGMKVLQEMNELGWDLERPRTFELIDFAEGYPETLTNLQKVVERCQANE